MTTTELTRYEIDIEDIEYIRHGDKPLLARLYKPRGAGPFPLIVDLHGGAWCEMDRTRNFRINEPLAKSGVVVAALDFTMPPDAGYPASLVDVNYAIRWFKTRALELRSRPARIGILGVSSGGHQAMLAAMRPRDPRYGALRLPGKETVDATLRCVILCWPVIDPLGRYHYAQELEASGKLKKAGHWLACHDRYWRDEAAMAEANPTLALERGEAVELLPVLYVQGTADVAHPRPNVDRFVDNYRKAGGRVDLRLFEGHDQNFINRHPDAPASIEAIERIIAFVHEEIC